MNIQRTRLPEYAGTGPAIIEPSKTRPGGVRLPSRAVLCFFGDALENFRKRKDVKTVYVIKSEMGRHPIYILGRGKDKVAVFHPGIGAPMAAAGMEQLVAMGVKFIVACGGAGVLHKDLKFGSVIIPTAAVRDEGTSFHYQPRGRINRPHRDAVIAIKQSCQEHDTPFVTGITWTTDAVFRETPQKVRSRKDEGCLTVEMEAAAFDANKI